MMLKFRIFLVGNESLIILKNPQSNIDQIKYLLNELNSLISSGSFDTQIILQIEDIKTQWIHLSDLYIQLTILTEEIINKYLLQFNWIIEQFNQLNINNYHISNEYSNIKMNTNTHLILLTIEQERKEIIKQHRYELQSEVIKIARSALQRHDEFVQRNKNRDIIFNKFLNEMSVTDLEILLSVI